MENIKLISFFVFLLSCMFMACSHFSKECSPNKSISTSKMSLVDSTDNVIIFASTTEINDICYETRCIYDNDVNSIVYQLIRDCDTIEFENDEFFVYDSIYDFNQNGFDDWIVKYKAMRGEMSLVFYFSPQEKRLLSIPDTIFEYLINN